MPGNQIQQDWQERILRLPKWASVALAARNAFRILPAVAGREKNAKAARANDIRNAITCCAIALNSANTGGGYYASLGNLAASKLFADVKRKSHPIACIAAASQASYESNPAGWHQCALQNVAAYLHAADAYNPRVGTVFGRMLEVDLKMFEQLALGYSNVNEGQVSLQVLSRPLYLADSFSVPDVWERNVLKWVALLNELEARDVFITWTNVLEGNPYRQNMIVKTIDAWIERNDLQPKVRFPPEEGAHNVPLADDNRKNVKPNTGPLDLRSDVLELPQIESASGAQSMSASIPQSEAASPSIDTQESSQTKSQGVRPRPALDLLDELPLDTAQDAGSHASLPKPPDGWMLSDRPLDNQFAEQDRFQFKDYADALATILDHPRTDTPFTMAINAPWGAGKTTLANMVAAELQQRPKDRGESPHIICRFNAWMHDDAPNLATAFVSEVSRTANKHRGRLRRIFDPLPAELLEPTQRRWRRIWNFTFVAVLMGLSIWWIGDHLQHVDSQRSFNASKSKSFQTTQTVTFDDTGRRTRSTSETANQLRAVSPTDKAPEVDSADSILGWIHSRMTLIGAFVTALAGLIGAFLKFPTSLSSFVESPAKAAETGTIQAAQRRIKRLIEQATWRGNRVIVFVDDIERCRTPRAIDVLDAVNQLMDHEGVVVVLLGDMAAVAAAAQLKYKELAEIYVPSSGNSGGGSKADKESFGRLYLQKIIQFQFDLPIPPKDSIRAYMVGLASELKTEDEAHGR